MNTQLVETLAQIIQTLSPEERALLEKKLQKPDLSNLQQRIEQRASKINAYPKDKPLDPLPEEIIHQMREERTEELMRSSFPQLYSEESK